MKSPASSANDYILGKLWEKEYPQDTFKYSVVKILRIIYTSIREFYNERLNLISESLTYTTFLSLAPLLALAFSLVIGIAGFNVLETALNKLFAPLGEQSQKITNYLIGFVKHINVRVLGTAGFILLLITLFSVIFKIEDIINRIWEVKREKGFLKKLFHDTSVIIIGPLLMFISMIIKPVILNNTVVSFIRAIPLGNYILYLTRFFPLLIIIASLSFVYFIIPNMRINFKSALTGAVIAGILWEVVGWAFASFVATSSSYSAIYSSFAIFILLLLWVNLSWTAVLLGAKISFRHQFYRKEAPPRI